MRDKNWLEWTVFGLGLILVAAVLIFLAVDAMTPTESSPAFRVALGRQRVLASHGQPQYAVPVTVRNLSRTSVEAVQLRVSLQTSGRGQEQVDVEIAFLPRESTGDAEVCFVNNPGMGHLSARVVGYELP